MIPGYIEGSEERKALNVIPMGVREQHRGAALALAKSASQERDAEAARTRAAIDHDDFAVGQAHRHAGCVAAVAHGGRARRWNGSAHAPKGDFH